jgi:multiple sugar transport system permease protein
MVEGFLILLLAYFVIPLIWLAFAMTKSNGSLFQSFGFWFGDNHFFQNLSDLFARDNGAFGQWLKNTAIYAIAAAVGSTLISTWAGYAFAMYRFRGRGVLFAIVLGSVFVPAPVHEPDGPVSHSPGSHPARAGEPLRRVSDAHLRRAVCA